MPPQQPLQWMSADVYETHSCELIHKLVNARQFSIIWKIDVWALLVITWDHRLLLKSIQKITHSKCRQLITRTIIIIRTHFSHRQFATSALLVFFFQIVNQLTTIVCHTFTSGKSRFLNRMQANMCKTDVWPTFSRDLTFLYENR